MDASDVIEPPAQLLTQRKRRFDRRMGQPSAWIGLDAVSDLDEIPPLAEVCEWLVRPFEVAPEGIEIARVMLKRSRQRREPILAQQRRHHRVAGRIPGMH